MDHAGILPERRPRYTGQVDAGFAQDIRRWALHELGFALVGFTDASPLPGQERLYAWLHAGAHGEMDYMARTASVRADPQHFLPGARSVVVVALSYRDRPFPLSPPPPGTAYIARYAQRRDYHQVMRRRLVRLGRALASRRPGCRWRVAVDTAPLLERELAQKAGLGWIGRNTCLINRHFGSELFLGELVTDLELPPDPPARSHCGRCTACLAACPTGALASPGFLNARRCLAYLTLEHRSSFTAEEAAALGTHLAGCDECQKVCPWNRRAFLSCDPALQSRPDLVAPPLAVLSRFDEIGWRRFAAGTPLRRLDFRRFSRNLQSLANSQGDRKFNSGRPGPAATRAGVPRLGRLTGNSARTITPHSGGDKVP